LVGCHRRHAQRTTRRDATAAPAADLVQRTFRVDAPDRLWIADITYLPTWQGFLYLAVVLDVFSRKVIGWAMADHLRSKLVEPRPRRTAVFEYLEVFYNVHRRHSALGYLSPADYERRCPLIAVA
jgi:transposase InsO family protein